MKIYVLFKTHLDVGFTDFSKNVIRKYNEIYIPKAIEVAKIVEREGRQEKFVWTTGSWLIWQYLKCANKEEADRMKDIIRKGYIRWHGLPFTMHSEAADKELFAYGLSLAKELDASFNVQTIAAKMTDVPGHTCGIIPLLANEGIEFLHLGVNPAACAPEVPDIFRWKMTKTDKEIVVMYNKGNYGEFTILPGGEAAIYFAHSNDNMGPPTAQEVHDLYIRLREEYPQAEIIAADLNDVALEIRKIRHMLPVVTEEIGDTWIHGLGTDPQKVSAYREMLRFAKELEPEERNQMYSKLLMIPEHTWGLNENLWLRDFDNYTREHFEAVRGTDKFQKMEESWQEQRHYICEAVESMTKETNRAKGLECLRALKPVYPEFSIMEKLENRRIVMDDWKIEWNENGAISYLAHGEKILAEQEHMLAFFEYEVFSEREIEDYIKRYIKPNHMQVAWAIEDNTKPGLAKEHDRYIRVTSQFQDAYTDGISLYIRSLADHRAYEEFGCPKEMILQITPMQDKLFMEYVWYEKPANRIPEGVWLHFNFLSPIQTISKLGSPINPYQVVECGNREMHGTDGMLDFGDVELTSLDAPLVSLGQPNLYGFRNQQPDGSKGVWINLFNNQWGTNFPMWNEGNAKFRFVLTEKTKGGDL